MDKIIYKFLTLTLVATLVACSGETKEVFIIDNSINKDDFFNRNKESNAIVEQDVHTNTPHQKTIIAQSFLAKETVDKDQAVKGTWIAPITANIKKGFSKHNPGLTFATRAGLKVVAMNDGAVVYSSDNLKAYGKMVIIKHKYGFYSHYMFNQEVLVEVGDTVEQGQEIAITSKNPLHISMKKFTTVVNPAQYINVR